MSDRRASGFRAWVLQRVTAVYLGLFTFVLWWRLILAPPGSYEEWHAWVATPWVNIGLLLWFASLLLHAWIGMRDVLIDYAHPLPLKILLLMVTGFGLIGCGWWVVEILFVVGVG